MAPFCLMGHRFQRASRTLGCLNGTGPQLVLITPAFALQRRRVRWGNYNESVMNSCTSLEAFRSIAVMDIVKQCFHQGSDEADAGNKTSLSVNGVCQTCRLCLNMYRTWAEPMNLSWHHTEWSLPLQLRNSAQGSSRSLFVVLSQSASGEH